jgi:hypothetical protein
VRKESAMNINFRIAPPLGKALLTLMLAVSTIAVGLTAEGWAQTTQPASKLSRAETEKATEALVRWFECDECEEGELNNVTKYGAAVVPSLEATLRQGPSAANREVMRRTLEARYAQLMASGQERSDTKPATSKDDFVAMYMRNYEAQYRARAAQALGAIGGNDATKILEQESRSSHRSDVQQSLQKALETSRSLNKK